MPEVILQALILENRHSAMTPGLSRRGIHRKTASRMRMMIPVRENQFPANDPSVFFLSADFIRDQLGKDEKHRNQDRADPQKISETGPAGISGQNRSHAGDPVFFHRRHLSGRHAGRSLCRTRTGDQMAFPVQKSVHRLLCDLGFLLHVPGQFSGFRRLRRQHPAVRQSRRPTLVNTAVEAMFELRRELFPDAPDEEPYPDRLNRPLVDLPPKN